MTDALAKQALVNAKTIAVLGCHHEDARPAAYVPAYLKGAGYRIIPVNPTLVGRELFGEQVRATLQEIGEPVDMVDVFRRAEDIPSHLPDILAMRPLPSVVWFQLGIVNEEAAAVLLRAGISVVQDRCTFADHRRFRL